MAISCILLTVIANIFIVTYKAVNTSDQQSTAQNLAVMSIRQIEYEVRETNFTNLGIYSSVNSINGTAIYFDSTKHVMNIGTSTFLGSSFNNYRCTLNFSEISSTLLGISIVIDDNNGNLLYSTTTSVAVGETIGGNATSGGMEIVLS